MSYVEKNLIPGEELVYLTGLHWCVLAGPAFVAALATAGGVACLLQKNADITYVGAILVIVGAGILVVAVIKRSATEMAVTNRRVIIKTGIASRRSLEIMLPKVESTGIDETVLGRMLGYGTVTIHGTGGTPEPFSRIAHPSEFRRAVQTQIDAQK